jgi:hypothetical protein
MVKPGFYVAKPRSPALQLKEEPPLLVLFAIGLCSFGVYLFLLVALFRKRLLILLCALMLMPVVGLGVRLRHSERRQTKADCEQDEVQACGLHGFPAELGLAEWYTKP